VLKHPSAIALCNSAPQSCFAAASQGALTRLGETYRIGLP
jgi:hypothetical protein